MGTILMEETRQRLNAYWFRLDKKPVPNEDWFDVHLIESSKMIKMLFIVGVG
jgi:hypothetical protein